MRTILLSFVFLLFLGCSDQGEVFIQDKKILNTHIECMQLVVFPPNEELESSLESLYKFEKECPYKLVLSYKTGIICNSNQNYDKKVGGLPSSYLRMEIKKNNQLLYTYYKDLKEDLKTDDLKQGFEVIQDDLDF